VEDEKKALEAIRDSSPHALPRWLRAEHPVGRTLRRIKAAPQKAVALAKKAVQPIKKAARLPKQIIRKLIK
jgi:hypothetical protein